MKLISKIVGLFVASLGIGAAYGQTITATDINYGNGAVVKEETGSGAPTDACQGLLRYTQNDTGSGNAIEWICVGGHMHLVGAAQTSYTGTSPIHVTGSTVSIDTATDSQSGAMSPSDHAALTAVQTTVTTDHSTLATVQATANAAATPASVNTAANAAQAAAQAASLPLTGGVMTGPISLSANPTLPAQAANKNYVDTHPYAPLAISGALADFDFLQGTGTSLTDISGSGNNGTLGTATLAPVWTGTGMSFSGQQQVALPAAVNSARTFFIGVYITPLADRSYPNSGQTNQYPMLVGSSLGSAGLNLMYDHATSPYINNSSGIFSPTIYSASALQSSAVNMVSGFHVFTYVLGTSSGSLDHLYIDGIEVAYGTHTFTGSPQTSGNLFLGSSDTGIFTQSGLIGTMYRFAALSSGTLTAAQIAQISGQITADVASRGVAVVPAPTPSTGPVLDCLGDSITAGYPSLTPYCSLLSLTNQPTYTIINRGIIGITAQAVAGSESNRVAPTCSTNGGPINSLVFLGTNDYLAAGQTPTTVLASLGSEIQTLKTAGCRVFVGTMLSRSGNTQAGSSFDSTKDAYDTLILSNAKAMGADGIMDFAASPTLGADGASANPANFEADGTHPLQSGQQLLANIASNSLNYYYGYTLASPHSYTASATLASGDRAVTIGALAGNIALVMPDCTGPSGESYTIINPQAVFAVTIAGGTNQPINGLTSAITIPANSTITLRDVANSKVVSGCQWAM